MQDTLKLILDELKDLKKGQEELKVLKKGQEEIREDVSKIKSYLINGLGPYFERIEKHIDHKTDELKDTGLSTLN